MIRMLALVVAAVGIVVACGGDDDGADEPPRGSEPPPGSATLTIGDESWAFDNISCAFSQEEVARTGQGNPTDSFLLEARSEAPEGVGIYLNAEIVDERAEGRYEGDDVDHYISLVVTEYGRDTSSWVSITGSYVEVERAIRVDGKKVTADAAFADRLPPTTEETSGTLRATCP